MAGAAEMYLSAVARLSLAALPSSWPSLISRQVKVKQRKSWQSKNMNMKIAKLILKHLVTIKLFPDYKK